EYQVKRGFEVFRRICAKCHSLTLFKPSDLTQLGYTNSQASLSQENETLMSIINSRPMETLNHLNFRTLPICL
ncbi:MAG: cytochrome c1, partial [Candidatus Hodgkinia cicadicola]